MASPILTKGWLSRQILPKGKERGLGLLLLFPVKEYLLGGVGGGLGVDEWIKSGCFTHWELEVQDPAPTSFSRPIQM